MTEENESRVWNVLRLGADMQAGTEESEERRAREWMDVGHGGNQRVPILALLTNDGASMSGNTLQVVSSGVPHCTFEFPAASDEISSPP